MNQFENLGKPNEGKNKEACETCTDFKDWMNQSQTRTRSQTSDSRSIELIPDCPLRRDQYGRYAWSYLHTMAAYYPDQPTFEQQASMSSFIGSFAEFFPCKECGEDFKDEYEIDYSWI